MPDDQRLAEVIREVAAGDLSNLDEAQAFINRLIAWKLRAPSQGRPAGDLFVWLEQRGYKRWDLIDWLWESRDAGFSRRVAAWGAQILAALVQGKCNCHEGFWSDLSRKKALARCRRDHILTTENLAAGQKQYADPVCWLKRAVYGNCPVSRARGFGYSMFCCVFDTPRESKIRVRPYRENGAKPKYILYDDRDGRWHEDDQFRQQEIRCLVCPTCRNYVGESSPASGDTCVRDGHGWEIRTVPVDEPPPGGWKQLRISTCEDGHFWPWTELVRHCPECGRVGQLTRRKLFVPDTKQL